ncbi:Phosphoribosylglycinamide formyltransferase [Aedoeadaptatus ivorii]|uniref:Phosphoribosylglycinamide formyltransferase n=1 Tax=Aedoeadaptatus ivorii TaxID=54006 RepID=A0A448V2T3_9FIRM|nr:phosphoribosylglycinamide formyltransferase [Peptoniphilus ivorii]VEJ36096.1 Phosphoribosylglycinamide formyltransferase [Peptoniphilus ivorii]
MRVAVLISGSGSNLEALLEAEREGFFESEIALVVSSKPDAYGLVRAETYGKKTFVTGDGDLLDALEAEGIDFLVLAGYLKILEADLLERYEGRILNIHPSLLPKYGGKGMYGMRVHEAVFENNEKISGATVHYVNEDIDGGRILLQTAVDISRLQSPEEIQQTVLVLEHQLLKIAVRLCEEERL